MSGARNLKLRVFGVVLLVFGFATTIGFAAENSGIGQPGTELVRVVANGKSVETSADSVRIDLHSPKHGVTSWRIPKAFLVYREDQKAGEHWRVTLELDWETMSPWSIAESQHGKSQSGFLVHKDKVRLTIRTSHRYVRRLLAKNFRKIDATGRLFEQSDIKEISNRQYKHYKNQSNSANYFIPLDNNAAYSYYIKCHNYEKLRIGRCLVASDMGDDLFLKYQFSQDFLDRWLELDTRIRRLLSEFRIGDRKSVESESRG